MLMLLDTGRRLAPLMEKYDFIGGQLMTPAGKQTYTGGVFGIDNGAFSGFDPIAFERLLQRMNESRSRCLFVASPDVVGNARRTLEAFGEWVDRLSGWPVALVAQDGQEDLPIPWDHIEAIFIGGSTEFKMSDAAADIVRTAKIIGKHVHVGRVNTAPRFRHFEDLHADTCDGTGVLKDGKKLDKIAARNKPDHPLFATGERNNDQRQ